MLAAGMAKADDAIKELQRRLGRLARLDGVVVRAVDGPVLVASARWDPFALLTACSAGRPTVARLLAAATGDAEPQRLAAATLARARRDLKILAATPWLSLVRAAPRHFRGLHRSGPLDERWLLARQARVDALARTLQPAAATEDPEDPLADPLHQLVADLHGPAAALALGEWIRRSAELGAGRRREAARRIEGLARRLAEPGAACREPPGLSDMLDRAAAELVRLSRLPGRAAARRFEPILLRTLAWPAAPPGHPTPVPSDSPEIDDRPAITSPSARLLALAARVREHGGALVRALGSTRSAAQLAALRRVLGLFALCFPIDPDGPRLPPIDPDELAPLESRLRLALATTPAPSLSLTRALWLLRLPISPELVGALAPWLADGLDPALVERLIAIDEHGRLVGLAALGADAELAAAYAQWLLRLVPHYRRLGVAVELPPQHFMRLHATHRGGLALLAHCLFEHHAADERGADAQLARLRATLGLFAARPRRAEALLAELTQAPPGRGRERFPEFADWLGDAAVLDRYCHLCVLADEPVALSNSLRRDFDRHDRLVRQRDHLAALPTHTPALRARLGHLEAELQRGDLGDRGWTLRRLGERCDALQARAFARKLDDLLRDVLRDAIGIAPPSLTPAWRDALRFYLGAADRNRLLLGDLLRFAARHPGRPIAPTLARNQAWLARAAARMRTDPWLAPRVRHLELAGERHTLCVEDDPLEVLRMGLAFGTCLALDDGFNADSTVLNAVDVNKRVLYLRDARGSVVARKLIAVASDFTLLGYHLYCARDAEGRPAVRAAVDELCRELADACGLPLADHGAPEQIHPGFWYDDGAEPWSPHGSVTGLADYFAGLGRPVPEDLSEWAGRQARACLAAKRGELELGLSLLPELRGGPHVTALRTMIAARLDPRELARRARRDPTLARVLLATRARDDVPALLRAATGVALDSRLAHDLVDAAAHALPSAALARAWLAAAAHERRHAPHFDDHGLAHATTRIGEALACLPVAELLAACPELAALWAWVVAESPDCGFCREQGIHELHRALASAHAREPDPAAVISALRGRHGPLAQDAALHLAARFSLSHRPCALEHGAGATWLTRLTQRPLPAPQALRALRELLRARPDLADEPDMFAALVRQAGPQATHQDLPRPACPPLEALAELLLHLPDPAGLLAPWLGPRADDEPPPDLWLLHAHRRAVTPWRRQLARRAAADEPATATAWLARLGDVEALTRLGRTDHRGAQHLRWQVALHERPAAGPPDMSLLTAALTPRRLVSDPLNLDLGLLREAARALAAPIDPAALALALPVFRAAGLPPQLWHDLVGCLLRAGPPAPGLLPILRDLLQDPALAALPAAMITELAAIPALHGPLLQHLAVGLKGHRLAVHALISQLERAPCHDPAARDELIAAVILEAGDEATSLDTPLGAHERERFDLCLRAWLQRGTPAQWLANYRDLYDLGLQSRMLDALLTLAPARADELLHLRDLAAREWTPERDLDATVARGWLLAALADLPASPVPTDMSPRPPP